MEYFMNLTVNEGDALNSVPFLRMKVTRQDLKGNLNGKILRKHLLSKGIAHSFYKGFLWAAPVDGKSIYELDLKEVSENFLRWGEVKIQELSEYDLFSDEYWFSLSIVILRDAVSYALYNKLKEEPDLITRIRNVYDKKQIIYSGQYSYVILGLSLNKILRFERLKNYNICICPEIVYECYGLTNRIVEDRFEKQINILKAARCNSKEYYRRLSLIAEKIFPLKVILSNKTLKFYSINYPIEKEKLKLGGLRQWL